MRETATTGNVGTGVDLYARWVLANAAGEGVGLGLTALIFASTILYAGEGSGPLAALALAALAILAGTFVEGSVVGTAQWLVLRAPLPSLRWRTWAVATGVGAFVAWTLGMVPSTALSFGGGREQAAEPPLVAMLGLAFLMGLVLGPVLGFAQWVVLRRFVGRAWLWMPASALAWALGMVVIFGGVELAVGDGFGAGTVALLAATLVCAGAVVGAVPGAALLVMLRNARGVKG